MKGLRLFLLSALAALCAGTLIAAYAAIRVSVIDAPFWDEWGYVDPHETLRNFLKLHNRHPLLTGKIVILVDYYLFGAQAHLQRALLWLQLATVPLCLVVLSHLAGVRDRLALATIGAVTLYSVFSPFAWENLRWGFQVAWVAGLVGPTVAVTAIAYYAERRKTWLLLVSHFACIVGAFGLASALFAPLLIVAMALVLRLGRGVPVGFMLNAACLWTLFFFVREGGGKLADPVADAPAIANYLFAYLGGLYGSALDYLGYLGFTMPAGAHLATSVGLLALLLSLALVALSIAQIFRSPRPNAGAAGLISIIMLSLLTGALTALGRVPLGDINQAMSSRYGLTSALFVCSTLALLYLHLTIHKLDQDEWLPASAILLGLIMLAASIPLINNLGGRQREELGGLTALVTGVRDLPSIRKLSPDPEHALQQSTHFKASGKFFFYDAAARHIGEKLEHREHQQCLGKIVEVVPVTGGARIRGQTPTRSGARSLLVLDAGDVVIGYGRLPADNVFHSDGDKGDWQGHVRANTLAGTRGLLVDKKGIPICQLW